MTRRELEIKRRRMKVRKNNRKEICIVLKAIFYVAISIVGAISFYEYSLSPQGISNGANVANVFTSLSLLTITSLSFRKFISKELFR